MHDYTLVCPQPPEILIGMAESIIGNPPYEENDFITYNCATNYTIHGRNENICEGPPDYSWTLTGSTLPTCLKRDYL